MGEPKDNPHIEPRNLGIHTYTKCSLSWDKEIMIIAFEQGMSKWLTPSWKRYCTSELRESEICQCPHRKQMACYIGTCGVSLMKEIPEGVGSV